MGSILVYGAREIAYPIGGAVKEIDTEIWCQTPGVIGGAAAGSSAGALYLAKQLEELANNPDLQPTYVQWTSTTGALSPSQDDGWYLLRDLQIDYRLIGKGTVHFSCSFAAVNPGAPRRIGVYTAGGSLSSNYLGAATNWVGFPLNATVPGAGGVNANRTGGEGVAIANISPVINPLPFVPSATIADWFKGSCHVYDAMAAIGTNPVPAAPTFLNTNWVEVKGADHRFVGDVVITNGLQLITLAVGSTPGVACHLWNTALATAGWQQYATLQYNDNSGNTGTLRQISLTKVGLEELAVNLYTAAAATGQAALLTLRLQRNSYAVRVDFRPLVVANTSGLALNLFGVPNLKVTFTETGAGDFTIDPTSAITTNYGYAAGFANSATYPFILGLLWQNKPNNQQGQWNGSTAVGFGETTGPALNATRSYGFFAIPFGSVSGGTTVDKLQAEAESGTLGTGWTSQAGAGGNSNGLEAKCASGTLTGNADTFGTAFVPPPQAYDVWFRVKVTNAAGAASEMKLGLYNSTDSVFVSSTTYRANQVTTSYVWYRVAAAVTPTATKSMRFRAETTATIGTDWFVDEAALVPTTDGANSVQDLWSQFMYDRVAVLKRS